MELIFIIILAGVTAFNYYYYRRIMAPAVLFSLLWTIVLGLHALCRITLLPELFSLSVDSQLLFTSGPIIFSAGSIFCTFFQKTSLPEYNISQTNPIERHTPISFVLRLSLVLVCVLVLPLYIKQAIDLFVRSQVDNFLMGLRTEISYGDENMGPFLYLVSLATIVFGLCHIEALRNPARKNKLLALISTIILIVYTIFSTSRTQFVTMIMLYLGIQVIYNAKFKPLKIFLWLMPVILLLFTAYGLLYNKGGNLEASASENVSSSSENTAIYLVGSLSAFDYQTTHQFHVENTPYNSLRFFYLIGKATGLVDQTQFDGSSTIQDFVSIPYPINVFTFYSPYIRDFGFVYPLLILFLLGALHTWVYLKAVKTNKANYAMYYSFLLYPLILSFFDDQYFTLFSLWVQTIIIVEGIFIINKMFLKKEKGLIENIGPSISF